MTKDFDNPTPARPSRPVLPARKPEPPRIDFVATYKVPRQSLMSAADWLFVVGFVAALAFAFCAGWKLGSMRP